METPHPDPTDWRLTFSGELERLDSRRALWADAPSPDARTPRREARVRQAVQEELTQRQRLVVEKTFYEGLSQGQIAKELGISQQVVSRTLHGSRRGGRMVGGALPKLRRALAELS